MDRAWPMIRWMLGGMVTTIFSGAGFIIITVAIEYAKAYRRDKVAKEKLMKELLDAELEWSPGHEMVYARIAKQRERFAKGVSLFEAYKRSPIFLGNTYPNGRRMAIRMTNQEDGTSACHAECYDSGTCGSSFELENLSDSAPGFKQVRGREISFPKDIPSRRILRKRRNRSAGVKQDCVRECYQVTCHKRRQRSQDIRLWSSDHSDNTARTSVSNGSKVTAFNKPCNPNNMGGRSLLRSAIEPAIVNEVANKSGGDSPTRKHHKEIKGRIRRQSDSSVGRKESKSIHSTNKAHAQSDGNGDGCDRTRSVSQTISLVPERAPKSLRNTSLSDLGGQSLSKDHVSMDITVQSSAGKPFENKVFIPLKMTDHTVKMRRSPSARRRYGNIKSSKLSDHSAEHKDHTIRSSEQRNESPRSNKMRAKEGSQKSKNSATSGINKSKIKDVTGKVRKTPLNSSERETKNLSASFDAEKNRTKAPSKKARTRTPSKNTDFSDSESKDIPLNLDTRRDEATHATNEVTKIISSQNTVTSEYDCKDLSSILDTELLSKNIESNVSRNELQWRISPERNPEKEINNTGVRVKKNSDDRTLQTMAPPGISNAPMGDTLQRDASLYVQQQKETFVQENGNNARHINVMKSQPQDELSAIDPQRADKNDIFNEVQNCAINDEKHFAGAPNQRDTVGEKITNVKQKEELKPLFGRLQSSSKEQMLHPSMSKEQQSPLGMFQSPSKKQNEPQKEQNVPFPWFRYQDIQQKFDQKECPLSTPLLKSPNEKQTALWEACKSPTAWLRSQTEERKYTQDQQLSLSGWVKEPNVELKYSQKKQSSPNRSLASLHSMQNSTPVGRKSLNYERKEYISTNEEESEPDKSASEISETPSEVSGDKSCVSMDEYISGKSREQTKPNASTSNLEMNTVQSVEPEANSNAALKLKEGAFHAGPTKWHQTNNNSNLHEKFKAGDLAKDRVTVRTEKELLGVHRDVVYKDLKNTLKKLKKSQGLSNDHTNLQKIAKRSEPVKIDHAVKSLVSSEDTEITQPSVRLAKHAVTYKKICNNKFAKIPTFKEGIKGENSQFLADLDESPAGKIPAMSSKEIGGVNESRSPEHLNIKSSGPMKNLTDTIHQHVYLDKSTTPNTKLSDNSVIKSQTSMKKGRGLSTNRRLNSLVKPNRRQKKMVYDVAFKSHGLEKKNSGQSSTISKSPKPLVKLSLVQSKGMIVNGKLKSQNASIMKSSSIRLTKSPESIIKSSIPNKNIIDDKNIVAKALESKRKLIGRNITESISPPASTPVQTKEMFDNGNLKTSVSQSKSIENSRSKDDIDSREKEGCHGITKPHGFFIKSHIRNMVMHGKEKVRSPMQKNETVDKEKVEIPVQIEGLGNKKELKYPVKEKGIIDKNEVKSPIQKNGIVDRIVESLVQKETSDKKEIKSLTHKNGTDLEEVKFLEQEKRMSDENGVKSPVLKVKSSHDSNSRCPRPNNGVTETYVQDSFRDSKTKTNGAVKSFEANIDSRDNNQFTSHVMNENRVAGSFVGRSVVSDSQVVISLTKGIAMKEKYGVQCPIPADAAGDENVIKSPIQEMVMNDNKFVTSLALDTTSFDNRGDSNRNADSLVPGTGVRENSGLKYLMQEMALSEDKVVNSLMPDTVMSDSGDVYSLKTGAVGRGNFVVNSFMPDKAVKDNIAPNNTLVPGEEMNTSGTVSPGIPDEAIRAHGVVESHNTPTKVNRVENVPTTPILYTVVNNMGGVSFPKPDKPMTNENIAKSPVSTNETTVEDASEKSIVPTDVKSLEFCLRKSPLDKVVRSMVETTPTSSPMTSSDAVAFERQITHTLKAKGEHSCANNVNNNTEAIRTSLSITATPSEAMPVFGVRMRNELPSLDQLASTQKTHAPPNGPMFGGLSSFKLREMGHHSNARVTATPVNQDAVWYASKVFGSYRVRRGQDDDEDNCD